MAGRDPNRLTVNISPRKKGSKMTLHKFQTEAANFRDNPNVLIDEENKTIWRILCRIPARRNDDATIRNAEPLVRNSQAAKKQVA
jgi:hypothetical protein